VVITSHKAASFLTNLPIHFLLRDWQRTSVLEITRFWPFGILAFCPNGFVSFVFGLMSVGVLSLWPFVIEPDICGLMHLKTCNRNRNFYSIFNFRLIHWNREHELWKFRAYTSRNGHQLSAISVISSRQSAVGGTAHWGLHVRGRRPLIQSALNDVTDYALPAKRGVAQ